MADVITVVEFIQLIYKIPSTLLMILSIYVIIKEIKNKNTFFNTQFYTIIVSKLTNEVIYIITTFIFYKLPEWGFNNNFFKNNDWTATLSYILAAQQTTFMFFITLLISINRYIAVKYPLSFKVYFSKSRINVILLSFIIFSIIIGLGNILFNARYENSELFEFFIPIFTSKNVIYYQIFYTVFLFGTISIATCTFNVMAILALKKRNLIGNKYKKELYYIIYSIFIFITLFFVEAFFVCRFIAVNYEIKIFVHVTEVFHIVVFDLTSFGDFYFLVYSW
uniref:Serpentine receptor class gamma n=1 Tax=Strongyloides papillosus TaxID=174720 RepID=A0A0N5B5R2_STREA